MRLKRFLSEDEFDLQSLRDMLLKDCKKYINTDFKSGYLYRGIEMNLAYRKFIKMERRTESRKPQGTNDTFFPFVNKWLKNNGFLPRDKATCVTADIKHTNRFGNPAVFFPVGNYKYTSITSQDFNSYPDNDWNSCVLIWALGKDLIDIDQCAIMIEDNVPDNISGWDKTIEWLKKNPKTEISVTDVTNWRSTTWPYSKWVAEEKKLKNHFSNTWLSKTISNKWEVWFDCKEYYLVEPSIVKKLDL